MYGVTALQTSINHATMATNYVVSCNQLLSYSILCLVDVVYIPPAGVQRFMWIYPSAILD